MSGIILTPREISKMSRSVRPAAEEGSQAWGAARDVLGKDWEVFKLESDTAALWDFTRGRGDPLLDLTGNDNDLTVVGGPVRQAGGPFGWRYDLDGSGDGLYAASDPASLKIVGELTVEVLCQWDSGDTGAVISKLDHDGTKRSWSLLRLDASDLVWRVSYDGDLDDELGVDVAVSPDVTDLYVAAIFKPGTYTRLFVNGNLVAEETSGIGDALFDSTADVLVGGEWSTPPTMSAGMDGKVYAVRITPRAKGPAEIWEAGGRLF